MNPRPPPTGLLPTRLSPARLLLPVAALGVLTAACSSSGSTTTSPASAASAASTALATSTASPSAVSTPPMPTSSTSPEASPSGAAVTPTPAAPAVPAAAPAITIEDFQYQVPSSVPAGSRLIVANIDHEAHTLTLKGDPDVQVVVPGRGGAAMLAVPSTAGTYRIECDFHGNMHATLVVT